MPYVLRDRFGKITGLFANPQPPQPDGRASAEPDPLPDDHPEVVEFLKLHPPPPPLTKEDIEKATKTSKSNHEKVLREHEIFSAQMGNLSFVWSELELALSGLLYTVLNIDPPSSKLAYVVYFSPTSLEARTEIVDRTLTKFIEERNDATLKTILPLWQKTYKKIGNARSVRNNVAHGSPHVYAVGGTLSMRLTSPPFDPIRVGDKLAENHLPGMSPTDLVDAVRRVRGLIDCVDFTSNLIVVRRQNDDSAFAKIFQSLSDRLQKLSNP